MMALAVAVATLPPLLFGGAWSVWFYEALVILVIACLMCASDLHTGQYCCRANGCCQSGRAIVKGGAYLEAPARLRVIALDKTGTLTYGHPVVQEVIPLNGHTERELLTCD